MEDDYAKTPYEYKEPDQDGWLGCVLVPVVVGLAAYWVFSDPAPETVAARDDAREILRAEQAVAARLRDPASASFMATRLATGGAVCGTVNARNGFGGMSGNQRFVVQYGVALIEGDEDFESVYSANC